MQEGSYTFKADGNLFYLKEDMACWKSDFVYMPSLALHVSVPLRGWRRESKIFKRDSKYSLSSNYIQTINT